MARKDLLPLNVGTPSLLESRRVAAALVLGAAVAVVVPVILLIAAARPVADDFALANVSDVPRYVIRLYRLWQGRWASIYLEATLFSKLPFLSVYSFILYGVHALQIVALVTAWRALLGDLLGWRGQLALAGVSFAFLLASYPAPAETVYWATGAIEYELSASLALLLLALLLSQRFREGGAWSPIRALAVGLFGFLIGGFHEIVGLILSGALVAAVALALLERRRPDILWVAALGGVVVGTAVNVLAPGNAIRLATDFSHARHLGASIVSTIQLLIVIARWALDAKLLAGSVLLALVLTASARPTNNRDAWRLRAWAIPLAGAGILFALSATVGFALGTGNIGRLRNLMFLAFTASWVASLHAVVSALPLHGHGWRHSSLRIARGGAAVAFALSLVISFNNVSVVHDLILRVPTWRVAVAARYDLVRRAAAKDGATSDLVLPPLPVPDAMKLPFESDIHHDPNHWTNRSFARYFGVRSVRLDGAP